MGVLKFALRNERVCPDFHRRTSIEMLSSTNKEIIDTHVQILTAETWPSAAHSFARPSWLCHRGNIFFKSTQQAATFCSNCLHFATAYILEGADRFFPPLQLLPSRPCGWSCRRHCEDWKEQGRGRGSFPSPLGVKQRAMKMAPVFACHMMNTCTERGCNHPPTFHLLDHTFLYAKHQIQVAT